MKYIVVPYKSLLLFFVGALLVMMGMYFNLIVVEANSGMPVWTTNFIPKQGYFQIVDASEIEYLFLADIYPIFNTVYSLGDLFMFLGFALLCVSLVWIYSKSMKKWLKGGKKK